MLLVLGADVVGAAPVLLHRPTTQSRKRRALYGLNSMFTLATIWYFSFRIRMMSAS